MTDERTCASVVGLRINAGVLFMAASSGELAWVGEVEVVYPGARLASEEASTPVLLSW